MTGIPRVLGPLEAKGLEVADSNIVPKVRKR